MQIEIRLCRGWLKKPLTVAKSDERPEVDKFGPESDIDKSYEDQVVGYINDTHIVALNIYPVFRPQYMLLSIDLKRSQNDAMKLEDISAAWQFINVTSTPMYAMYNCTPTAGCSRYHKHIQVLPEPRRQDSHDSEFVFFPNRTPDKVRVPYTYFLHRFDSVSPDSRLHDSEVFEVYMTLLSQCRKALGIAELDTTTPCPHNAILVKGWMLLIPRRSNNVQGLMVNSAGMLGMPTVLTEEMVQKWRDAGPGRVLAQFGIPQDT